MPLFIILLTVPLIEIALFVTVGDRIGLAPTLAVVVATAILGAFAIRTQGRSVLMKLGRISRPDEAGAALINGMMIAAAGLLLLTPGFLTDSIGLLLLIPAVRSLLAKRIVARATTFQMGDPRGPMGGAKDRRDGFEPRDDKPDHEAESSSAPSGPRKPVGKPMPDADDAVILQDQD